MEFFSQTQYLILGIFVLILCGLALFIYSVLKREQEFQKKEEESFGKYSDILDKARQQAAELLNNTSTTSANLLNETRSTSEHVEVDLDRVLQSIAQKHIEKLHEDTHVFEISYAQKLQKLGTSFDTLSDQLLTNASEIMGKEIAEATKALTEKSAESQKQLTEQIHSRLTQTDEQIATYKKERFAAIDEQVRVLVERTYREVLKTSIPDSVHDQMILESLEKAKAEGVFSL